MPGTNRQKILLIDSYDSFTFNLADLFQRAVPNSELYIVKNDEITIEELIPHLPSFAAIVVGPGPGSPLRAQDVGIIRHLWHLPREHVIPIFGVCLGLQSLAVEHGATLHRLPVVKHGQISHVKHRNTDLFEGVGTVDAVRYHSLHVTLSLLTCPSLEELAWADDGSENGYVVMALRHRYRPFWAVQYHPESVCTSEGGLQVVKNFWKLAQEFSKGRTQSPVPWDPELPFEGPWPPTRLANKRLSAEVEPAVVKSQVLQDVSLPITQIAELLSNPSSNDNAIVLDSAAHPGRYSIVGCPVPSMIRISHYVGDHYVSVSGKKTTVRYPLGGQSVWDWLSKFMSARHAQGGNPELPFWGGLVGYFSYALGVQTLEIQTSPTSRRHPDVNLVFVERSVVLDQKTHELHIQSIIPDDDEWITQTYNTLREAQASPPSQDSLTAFRAPAVTSIKLPDEQSYREGIKECQEYLFSGESYELCFTAQTRISLPYLDTSSSRARAWALFNRIRLVNPAPYSCFMRLGPSTLISSSPERFLSFSRGGSCQLRPIKGTARKSTVPTRQEAERILGTPKEFAENLMIVDLIRHDLHAVAGMDVRVERLCQVEEYETVWQLVSVIEGEVGAGKGWSVLKSCLPPGSMTGAPKKRSVEILQSLEAEERGIYSGVCGFWDVGGGGDFSVVIRSCMNYQDHSTTPETSTSGSDGMSTGTDEVWEVGAGGAITALSEVDAEWDEMVVKLQSVLRSFQ
ncbi:para-aminobenzoic acid synthetase [Sistotremastrum suecicum HHB10207 ss-3]|uniref:aminodeoxychorismate synthase n=1 Tax=Sistotremastrum suecicum HHB10207 ss-3 TaxID=1314776 RepID=A0A166FYV4_9AGAM|nr:para-aminobenzoic acid synthetase [Sistotremastrum suecicum HHB10207 ss-3]